MRHSEGTPGGDGGDLDVQWRSLVHGWAAGRHLRCEEDTVSVSLRFDLADAGRAVTVRFMTTTKLLVAFMTDGRFLRGDQLATAAAAANAWNTEQLVPMLSVWDVRGPRPCIAGVCTLPLNCRMDQPAFDSLAGDWVEQARQMFVRCHQVFQL
ncbi:hypothetical protein [Streptomyces melanogenes]|uniref:Uncharacterized protein n=1 Tax=Streptomyces melanogenes TaxID=67326 RepID=A0ABZ1XNB1_9ACTN|nr:hypothetical protein [Streptomyces melanogenes]